MIDIQPYIDKLDKLRGYMDSWIDFNMYSYHPFVLDLFFTTGILIYTNKKDHPSFEEWLELNNN